MEDDELRCALALHRCAGVGPILFNELTSRLGSAAAVIAGAARLRPEGRLNESLLDGIRNPDWEAVERDLAWGQIPGNTILTRSDARYPHLLSQIHDPPPVIFVVGDVAVLKRTQVALVGTRNPTPSGRELAQRFARELAQEGIVVTSGLAEGVDGAGHEGALETEAGLTIAVAGTGLDRVYPPRHHKLAHRIAARGALVSEYPLGTPPLAANFPRRNRIISGLSLGVLVVEAPITSGSLITARNAADQGRMVFAVPGAIQNQRARGCHALIREGATLVEKAQDILDDISPLRAATPALPLISHGPDEQKLLECFSGYDPQAIDLLVERSGLTTAQVSSMLLVLELQGWVAMQPGGLYTRIR